MLYDFYFVNVLPSCMVVEAAEPPNPILHTLTLGLGLRLKL